MLHLCWNTQGILNGLCQGAEMGLVFKTALTLMTVCLSSHTLASLSEALKHNPSSTREVLRMKSSHLLQNCPKELAF